MRLLEPLMAVVSAVSSVVSSAAIFAHASPVPTGSLRFCSCSFAICL
ncbi:MAG TPA: hypothetical protein PLU22_25960 [Polyangiaceae bacterium]|nr:hypothetical protein [Polyangiaceae bacterium]